MKLQALLPLVTYPDQNSDAIAANAASFAAAIGAELHALALTVKIPPVSNALSRALLKLPEMIRAAERQSGERGAHLLQEVSERAAAAGVEAKLEKLSAPLASIGDAAAVHARYFDLSLVGWEAASSTSRMVAEAVVFGSGRPAILLPEQAPVGQVDHLAIAWDGSRVAARAVADAGPLLRQASRISVLTVFDEKPIADREAGERLAASLARQGLSAEPVALKAEDCPIAETLQRTAMERECRLLVMGGYGHSRVRDFVLGGATEGVLGDLLLPVLLSH